MKRSQLLRMGLPVVAAGLLVVSETPLRVVAWERYPILGSFVSGLVFVALGYFLIDWWVEAQETRKWKKVAHSAFKSLGHSAEQFGDALQHLLTGRPPTPYSYEPPWPQPFTDRLVEVLSANVALVPIERQDPDGVDTVARLSLLFDDPDWVDMAISATVMLRFAQRRRVAPWLPAMLATSDLAGILNRAAGLDDRASDLEWPFLWQARRVRGEDTGGADLDPESMREQAIQWWQAALTEALSIHEGLVRAADTTRSDYLFTSERARRRLDAVHLGIVDDAHSSRHPLGRAVIGRSRHEVAV